MCVAFPQQHNLKKLDLKLTHTARSFLPPSGARNSPHRQALERVSCPITPQSHTVALLVCSFGALVEGVFVTAAAKKGRHGGPSRQKKGGGREEKAAASVEEGARAFGQDKVDGLCARR